MASSGSWCLHGLSGASGGSPQLMTAEPHVTWESAADSSPRGEGMQGPPMGCSGLWQSEHSDRLGVGCSGAL